MGKQVNTTRQSWLKKCLIRALQLGAILYVTIAVVLMLFEEKLIFPTPRVAASSWQLPEACEDVEFTSADGTQLHGWFFPAAADDGQTGNQSPCLLYSHGNGDCVAYLGDYANMLRTKYGLNVLIYDYRGYGKSDGHPTGTGVLADGKAACRWLADRCGVDAQQIIQMGRSLGGGVATHLAAEGAGGLIVESSFSSITETAAHHYPWLPIRWMMRTKIDSMAAMAHYEGPLLQSHGTADSIVPFELGRKLYDAARGEKEFMELPGLDHNDPQPREFYDALGRFLDRILNS